MVNIEEDMDFEYHVVEKVKTQEKGGWVITWGGCVCFYVPTSSVEPKVGMLAKFYPKGCLGSTVRGLFLDNVKVFYRTKAQQRRKELAELKKFEAEEKKKFEGVKFQMDARYSALPKSMQQRIDKFRNNNPDFRWKYEEYEMFVCEQAVIIAKALKEKGIDVKKFHDAPYEKAKEMVPGLGDGHSGNTFGMACTLARALMEGKDEFIVGMYGALAPLVGSDEYGCVPRKKEGK